MNPQASKFARQARLSAQTQMLYEIDADGHQVYDDDGNPVFNPDRAPAVLRDIGVPSALADATMATSQFKLVDEVRDWLVDILNGVSDDYLVLFIGDGRNHTAAAVLRNAVKRSKTVAWYSWNAFTNRYTDSITWDRLLDHGGGEEVTLAAYETYESEEENLRLFHVYDVLVIVDFDINDVRDFAVPDITALLRARCDSMLTTIITVAESHSGPLTEKRQETFGKKAALLAQFEYEGRSFDAEQ